MPNRPVGNFRVRGCGMTLSGPQAAPYVGDLFEHRRGVAPNIGALTAASAATSRDGSAHGG
ncbi:hypothetical protein MFTT_41290 [Mycolicibacterium fortuitum subsp. fortuitum]|nr:hypothetical protein MFTT_41290 [Mycolicibacterium fortuitum subsp. fortuitum]